jgi:hypothetical protein
MTASDRIRLLKANCLLATSSVLALIVVCVAAPPARALYEFATRDGQCRDVAIDRVGDGFRSASPAGLTIARLRRIAEAR